MDKIKEKLRKILAIFISLFSVFWLYMAVIKVEYRKFCLILFFVFLVFGISLFREDGFDGLKDSVNGFLKKKIKDVEETGQKLKKKSAKENKKNVKETKKKVEKPKKNTKENKKENKDKKKTTSKVSKTDLRTVGIFNDKDYTCLSLIRTGDNIKTDEVVGFCAIRVRSGKVVGAYEKLYKAKVNDEILNRLNINSDTYAKASLKMTSFKEDLDNVKDFIGTDFLVSNDEVDIVFLKELIDDFKNRYSFLQIISKNVIIGLEDCSYRNLKDLYRVEEYKNVDNMGFSKYNESIYIYILYNILINIASTNDGFTYYKAEQNILKNNRKVAN